MVGAFVGVDRHPATMPHAHRLVVKLIFARQSHILVGGEVLGGSSTGELTNLVGLAIQNRMMINSILTAQIGTHPLLTTAPTSDPFINAAEIAAQKIRSSEIC